MSSRDLRATSGVANGAPTPSTPELSVAERVAPHPCEDDPTREGIFRSHNCWKCDHGAKPCVRGGWNRCDYPRARND